MSKFTYSAPDVSLVSSSESAPPKNLPSALVVMKGHEPPTEWERELPAHLKDHGAWKGDLGARVSLHSVGGVPPRVIFGAGPLAAFNPQEASEHGEGWGRFLQSQKIETLRLYLPNAFHAPENQNTTLAFLKGLLLSNFRVNEFRSKQEPAPSLKKIEVVTPSNSALKEAELATIRVIVQATAFSRHLVELPGSVGTPAEIANRFKALIDPKLVQLEVWDEKRIAKEKMGLLMAVSQGSAVPPRFLVARYGKEYVGKKPLLALIGKGVTFDTGGINLKVTDWRALVEMKKDMGGCAGVLGTMLAIQALRPKLPVMVITPMTFNSIDARSVLPGDVVTSYSGKTVEILNTDAEGRLILADAIHFATTQKADMIVDVATLTGACVVALGAHWSGIFSNQDGLRREVETVAAECGEPAWPLPATSRYSSELKSEIADLANMGKARDGGASLGACFLEKFVAETPWIHLDIAGTVDLGAPAQEGSPVKGAGRMVHTLTELALRIANGQVKVPPKPSAPASSAPAPSKKKK
jgi:leucyl aminopeptidase